MQKKQRKSEGRTAIKTLFQRKGENSYEKNEENHGNAAGSNYDNGYGSNGICRRRHNNRKTYSKCKIRTDTHRTDNLPV